MHVCVYLGTFYSKYMKKFHISSYMSLKYACAHVWTICTDVYNIKISERCLISLYISSNTHACMRIIYHVWIECIKNWFFFCVNVYKRTWNMHACIRIIYHVWVECIKKWFFFCVNVYKRTWNMHACMRIIYHVWIECIKKIF